MHLLLVGNYGVDNLGDEALRDYFLRVFPQVRWTVVSARPKRGEVPRLPAGMRSLFAPWWKTLSAIRQSGGVVFGGGSLFTDVESVFACILWWLHVKVARMLGKPVFLAFQGVGPFRTKIGAFFARSALRAAAFVSVRDDASARRVADVMPGTMVVHAFDPVLSLFIPPEGADRKGDALVVIPRHNSGDLLMERVREARRVQQFERIVILSLQPEDASEAAYCQAFAQKFETAAVVPVRTLAELATAIATASLVIAERYHGALAAVALGVPLEIVPQADGDKLSALQALLERETIDMLLARIEYGEQALRKALDEQAS